MQFPPAGTRLIRNVRPAVIDHGPRVIGVAERIDRGTNAAVWKARARRPCRRLRRKHVELENPRTRLGLLRDEDEVRGVLLCPEGKTGLPSAIGLAAGDERELRALLPVDGYDGVEVLLRVEDHRDGALGWRFEPVPHARAGPAGVWVSSLVARLDRRPGHRCRQRPERASVRPIVVWRRCRERVCRNGGHRA